MKQGITKANDYGIDAIILIVLCLLPVDYIIVVQHNIIHVFPFISSFNFKK